MASPEQIQAAHDDMQGVVREWRAAQDAERRSAEPDADLVSLREHVPVGGGYGIALVCDCGGDWSPEHQHERMLAKRAGAEGKRWWE